VFFVTVWGQVPELARGVRGGAGMGLCLKRKTMELRDTSTLVSLEGRFFAFREDSAGQAQELSDFVGGQGPSEEKALAILATDLA
jgi:hypothetical protein